MSETLGSAQRTLETLLLFDADRHEIGVTELSGLLGCSTSSAQRCIHTLVSMQLLRKDPHRSVYRLGPGALQLARGWRSAGSLASVTRPAMLELARVTGLKATFAVADHAHMRAIVAIDGVEGPTRNYPTTGELFPAHVGAISKAYYAYLPRVMRDHLVMSRPLARYTPATSMSPEALETEFAKIRELGYSVTHGEYDELISALAMPVQASNDPLGTVSVATRGMLVVTDQLIAHTQAAARSVASLINQRS